MEDHHHPMGHGSEATPPKDAVDKGCGMFDFLKKKDHEEKPTEDMVMADAARAKEEKKEEDNKTTLMEKLHRSNSSSSSSSDEEGGGEGVEKRKIRKKEKNRKEADCDQNKVGCIPVEKNDATGTNEEEKKGFMEKMKEKLPGQHKKAKEGADGYSSDEEAKDNKGFLEKIKEKLPGSHKDDGEEKKH